MIQRYTKGNLEVLHGLITRRIVELNEDIDETKRNYSPWKLNPSTRLERLNRLDDECSFLEDLAECIEDMLERGEGR